MSALSDKKQNGFDIFDWYSLKGQIAIVTGGATGLGLAITRSLVSAGAKVCVIGSRHAEQLTSLQEFGNMTCYYRFDVTDTEHAEDIVKRIAAEHGRLDILVNNAGVHCKKYIWDMSVEEFEKVLNVHLTGAFALTKAVVPYMKKQGRGRIIFQASMTSYIGQPMVSGYSTAKAGILGMIHTLTAELCEYGITVNAMAPGWIETPMFHQAIDADPERLAKIMGRIPAKSVGDPMDIGMCAAFLASDAARYISGSCIPVDGGALIGF